jgi:NodT family efflux transporter outer membrane factor (OMF) lipoprotein
VIKACVSNGSFRTVPAALVALLLGACSYWQESVDPDPQVANQFSASGDERLQEKWWSAFQDEQLDHWVDKGLEFSPRLLAAYARYKEDEANWKIAGSDRFPEVDLQARRRRVNNDEIVDPDQAGLSINYQVDLWGRIAALNEQADWQRLAAADAVDLVANTVAAEISRAWFGWLAELEKVQLFTLQHQRLGAGLAAIERRFALGISSIDDVWQQRRLLESVESQRLLAEGRAARFRNRLAFWVGLSTDDIPAAPQGGLPSLPTLPQTGIPLETLKHRPDIRQSYAELEAAHAGVAAAISARFPRISLSADYESLQTSSRDLFDDWFSTLTGSLLLPIIDGGRRRADVDRQQARWQQAQADYRQRWLVAIREVEDALVTEKQQVAVVASISSQLELARNTEKIKRLHYAKGQASYIALLRAQETTLQLERTQVDARLDLVLFRTDLYQALSYGDFGFAAKSDVDREDI